MSVDLFYIAAVALGVFIGCALMTLAGMIGRRRVGR